MPNYLIQRKTDHEFFRGRMLSKNLWTHERLLARPYSGHFDATVAMQAAHISPGSVDVVPFNVGASPHDKANEPAGACESTGAISLRDMSDRRPRMYLGGGV